jgi:hypothetical protein
VHASRIFQQYICTVPRKCACTVCVLRMYCTSMEDFPQATLVIYAHLGSSYWYSLFLVLADQQILVSTDLVSDNLGLGRSLSQLILKTVDPGLS